MSSKIFLFVGLLIAIVFLFSTDVSARDLAETTEDNKKVETNHVDQYYGGYPGGGYGGYRGGGRGRYGGYPGGGYGGYPGGGRGRGGYGGYGRCYYGCCGYSYYGRGCDRCCYADEVVDSHTEQAQP